MRLRSKKPPVREHELFAANHALHSNRRPLGSKPVRVICQRLLQPTGCFQQRSLSFCRARQVDAVTNL